MRKLRMKKNNMYTRYQKIDIKARAARRLLYSEGGKKIERAKARTDEKIALSNSQKKGGLAKKRGRF